MAHLEINYSAFAGIMEFLKKEATNPNASLSLKHIMHPEQRKMYNTDREFLLALLAELLRENAELQYMADHSIMHGSVSPFPSKARP